MSTVLTNPSSQKSKLGTFLIAGVALVVLPFIAQYFGNAWVRIIDISLSGAGIATQERPEIGAHVTIGRIPGRVVRHLDAGFAIEFTRLQHPDSVEENATAQSPV